MPRVIDNFMYHWDFSGLRSPPAKRSGAGDAAVLRTQNEGSKDYLNEPHYKFTLLSIAITYRSRSRCNSVNYIEIKTGFVLESICANDFLVSYINRHFSSSANCW